MKKIYLLVFLSFLIFASFAQGKDLHAKYDILLKNHVVDGMVDYKALKANRALLDDYLKQMAAITKSEFDAWPKNNRLAYLINLYNAQTLKLIIDNYPLESIKDLGSLFKSPWEDEFIVLFGENVSLDDIEHEIIRKQYNEARIHLALVCAAYSCPPLRAEAYRGEVLSEQLDNQGFLFFSSPKGIQIDHIKKTVYLTSILKWYKEDFISVTAFAQRYAKEKFENYKLAWLKYDWKLNEKK